MPFQRLFNVASTHQYFAGQPCPQVLLHPTPACQRLMQRFGLLFRPEADGVFSVLQQRTADGKSKLPPCPKALNFHLLATDRSFFQYTNLSNVKPGNMLLYSNPKSAKKSLLECTETAKWDTASDIFYPPFGGLSIIPPTNFTSYTLAFSTPSVPWQYFVIAEKATGRYTVDGSAADIDFKPVDDAGKQNSNPTYLSLKQNFPDVPVFWFRSEGQLPLLHKPRPNIRLINAETQSTVITHLPNPTATDGGVQIVRV